jgi:mRNA (2'-O-methyladenosine-N6-)-methyltransferase
VLHYQIEDEGLVPSNRKELVLSDDDEVLDSQWVNCDIRYFDFKILGKFDVIISDTPWDIHMDLPYGTLSDVAMKNLRVQDLQDHGVIFLWVTGRATELAENALSYGDMRGRKSLSG